MVSDHEKLFFFFSGTYHCVSSTLYTSSEGSGLELAPAANGKGQVEKYKSIKVKNHSFYDEDRLQTLATWWCSDLSNCTVQFVTVWPSSR